MQTFYNHLFDAQIPPALSALTRLSRIQILDATRNHTWMLWGTA